MVHLPPNFLSNQGEGGGVTHEEVEIPTENWKESIKGYAQLLAEGFEYGVDCVKELLRPWTSQERWAAFMEFEVKSPQKMRELSAIAPDWFEWCDTLKR